MSSNAISSEKQKKIAPSSPSVGNPPPYGEQPIQYNPVEKKHESVDEESGLIPRERHMPRKWGFGFFDCLEDFSTFLCSCICPALVYAQNKQRINNDEECCMYTGLYCIVDIATSRQCGCVLAGLDRETVRKRQEIPGTLGKDLAVSWFCLPCSLTQQKLELDVLEGIRIPAYAQNVRQ
eukprot:NODE_1033_length_1899_cov_0.158333.p1 type:complete len:179 gc:universal NODE_1033_length_1899_cov_0.158333:525-1061(+)